MKKPEVYNIHGVLYRAVECKDLEDHGECDREKGLIKLAKALAPSPRRQVLRHELAHGAWWECGIYHRHLRAYGQAIADELEEDTLERFLPVYDNIRRVR